MLKDLSENNCVYTHGTPESKPIVGESAYKHKAGTFGCDSAKSIGI